jgi:hypothetical protein
MVEKHSNGSLKPTSLAKKLQASENDDPNSPTNNSPDVAAPKAAKPALTRQRSVKAHEDKPALSRQRSQKLLGTKPAVDAHAVRKTSGESNQSKSSSEKESDAGKAPGTPQKKDHNSAKPAVITTTGAVAKAITPCKTPVKEPASHHQETKKLVLCTDSVPGSPYSGHHCKSSRCAANDPNFASPVPTKKYLIAKRGTPGSLRKATPYHARGEDADDDGKKSETSSVGEAANVKSQTKVALDEVFQKMALDQSHEPPVEPENVTKQVTELSSSEVEDLKEVPLGKEDRTLSAADVRAWAGRSVNFEEKAASSSERAPEECPNEEPQATGIDKFLQVASECLENIDLHTLELPQSKQGKKR